MNKISTTLSKQDQETLSRNLSAGGMTRRQAKTSTERRAQPVTLRDFRRRRGALGHSSITRRHRQPIDAVG